jgi:hypothetical protein
MMIIKFRSDSEHKDLLHKVKKMKEYTEMLEQCLEDAIYEEEPEYRGSYRKEYDEEEMHMRGGRYGYRRGMR